MDEAEKRKIVREAMSIIGSKTSPLKAEKSAENALKGAAAVKGKPLSEAHKEKLRRSQLERRERERAAREAATPPEPKRGRGRPKRAEAEQVKLF